MENTNSRIKRQSLGILIAVSAVIATTTITSHHTTIGCPRRTAAQSTFRCLSFPASRSARCDYFLPAILVESPKFGMPAFRRLGEHFHGERSPNKCIISRIAPAGSPGVTGHGNVTGMRNAADRLSRHDARIS